MLTVLLITIIILLTVIAINSFFPNSDKENDIASKELVLINLFIVPLVSAILGGIYYFFFRV